MGFGDFEGTSEQLQTTLDIGSLIAGLMTLKVPSVFLRIYLQIVPLRTLDIFGALRFGSW
jgi:hypothetical protein